MSQHVLCNFLHYGYSWLLYRLQTRQREQQQRHKRLKLEKEQLNFVNYPLIPNLDFKFNVDLQPNSRLQRWRKCSGVVDSFVQQMDSRLHSFNGEEKQEIVKKFIEHQGVVNYIPHYAILGKETNNNRVVMDAMKATYAQITST